MNAGRAVPGGLLGYWPSRSVTFLDNHDTEYRRDEEHRHHNDGTRHFPGNMVEMGYSYLLTHPGIPCVFWSHYFDWGHCTRQRILGAPQLLSVSQPGVGVESVKTHAAARLLRVTNDAFGWCQVIPCSRASAQQMFKLYGVPTRTLVQSRTAGNFLDGHTG